MYHASGMHVADSTEWEGGRSGVRDAGFRGRMYVDVYEELKQKNENYNYNNKYNNEKKEINDSENNKNNHTKNEEESVKINFTQFYHLLLKIAEIVYSEIFLDLGSGSGITTAMQKLLLVRREKRTSRKVEK